MPKLIQLDNGDWVDPDLVDSIVVLSRMQTEGRTYPDRVVVRYYKHVSVVYYESAEDAVQASDRLAAVINGTETPTPQPDLSS